MVLPPGRYNLEVTYTDGTSSFVNKNGTLESDAAKKDNYKIIDIKARDVLKNNDIYLEGEPNEIEWYLEPSVKADDIIVPDDSFDVSKLYNKGSDKYSFIKNNGKYNFISYDGEIVLKKWYNEPRVAECGDLGVYSGILGVYYTNYGGKDFSDEEEHNWLNRGAMSSVYYVFPYDKKTSEIYHDLTVGDPPHWGYDCTYNCDYDSAVLIQEANVKTTEYIYGADIDYTGKYGAAYDNKVTVSPIYDYGIMNVYNDMIALKSGNKWGYFNGRTGEKIIDFIADELDSDYYCESSANRSNYSDSRPYTYSDGYVSVKSDNEWALYDEEGNIVIDYGVFDEIRPVHNGKAWGKEKKSGLWGVISLPRTWQEIYKEKLSEYFNSDEYTNDQNSQLGSMFDLCDINDDGIPELFISEGIYASANVRVYTVANNKIQEFLRGGSYGELHVNKECSYIMTDWVRVGYELHAIYHLNDTDCNMIINLAGSYAYEDGTYENSEGYSINDVSVTKEEYLKQYKKYLDDIDWEFCGRKYNFNQKIGRAHV